MVELALERIAARSQQELGIEPPLQRRLCVSCRPTDTASESVSSSSSSGSEDLLASNSIELSGGKQTNELIDSQQHSNRINAELQSHHSDGALYDPSEIATNQELSTVSHATDTTTDTDNLKTQETLGDIVPRESELSNQINYELNLDEKLLEAVKADEISGHLFSSETQQTADATISNQNSETINRLLHKQFNDAVSPTTSADIGRQSPKHSIPGGVGSSPSDEDTCSDLGFHLRALRENISALEANPWIQAPTIPQSVQLSKLSTELVNETLNYFINCGRRLSQMTKTYDDAEAYILLLQEKEVDLELAARIGQDLLKQNKELKESISALEGELAKRREDVQQLKHELASKTSLLDTFFEEEEQHHSLVETEDDLTLRQQSENSLTAKASGPSIQIRPASQSKQSSDTEDDEPNQFLSLNYNNPQKNTTFTTDPFLSLPHHLGSHHDKSPIARDESPNSIYEDCLGVYETQQKFMQTVTTQLVESNKKLCELQDEILHKGEHGMLQQEKIFRLEQQLRESDQRLGDVVIENQCLLRSLQGSNERQQELSDELKACKKDFSELLQVFLELQKELRHNRARETQRNSNIAYLSDLDPINEVDNQNISFDSYNEASSDNHSASHSIPNHCLPRPSSSNTIPNSSSLLEELQGSMQNYDSSDNDATDGADSGVHTIYKSTSVTPSSGTAAVDSDNENSIRGEARNRRNWLGLSSFMLTTIFLLCLSLTLSSPSNNPKFHLKLDRR